ncbi:MAG: peptidase T [Planctomycetota bacterium]
MLTHTQPTVINRARLLERFLRYVQMDTTADPHSENYPSSEGQRDLGRVLASELQAMGADDVELDEHSLVYATLPSTTEGDVPTIALVAHMDTSPEAPGSNVKPRVIDSYTKGDIKLAAGNAIRLEDYPDLANMVGQTLVTTDGTTLLGGDDKAGVAIIMELAESLIEHPELEHGEIRIVMTCDEEIGRGTDKINVDKLGADVAYTVDGGGFGVVDEETFSADGATVTFTGHNIHPAIAKGRMVNSIRAAGQFIALLPAQMDAPESTEGRDGFIHAYEIDGGVGKTTVRLILRSFETHDLDDFAARIREYAHQAAEAVPGINADVRIKKQYRNLRDGLTRIPESIDLVEKGFAKLGVACTRAIIRGGTDGSQLTEKGLPTPNLSSGQHNIHSVLEFANLDEMQLAGEHLVALLGLWSEQKS